jgi:hypothetical protein
MSNANYRFLTYHPFSTFSNVENDQFLKSNGKPGNEPNADTEALFKIGKEAYRLFLDLTDSEQFERALAGYWQSLEYSRALIQEMVDNGFLEFRINENEHLTIEWENIRDDAIIGIAWQLYSKSQLKVDDEEKEYMARMMALHALIEIDNALLAMSMGGSGAIVATYEASNAVANLLSILSGDEKLQVARRDLAYQGAMARLERDPKQKEKTFIHECWQRWQQSPETYASKAAFARDMLSKCEHLTSQKKIEDWCREWESETGTQQAQ